MTFSRFVRIPFAFVLVVFALLSSSRAHAADPPLTKRVAIIVGANDPPPDRQPLRFAHDDAHQVADALERVGRFAHDDIHVLLDPHPNDLLTMIDAIAQASSADALVVFYYSGHSDGQSLYPHGEVLPIRDVRQRLSSMQARVRVGILDTCRGGSWTQAKGLTVGPPLDVSDLVNAATEGTALLSSSSGLENAHEADAVRGSFFTHYLVAGLLGAADANGDGEITLEEAFNYAKERTIRDSARLASTPQHPSFDIELRGRQDVVLASIRSSNSAIEIQHVSSPIEVIHLPSGVTLAEIPPSSQNARIAVPPAHYLIRRAVDGSVYSKEIEVRAGETVTLAEAQLEVTGNAKLAMKGGGEHFLHTDFLPLKHEFILQADVATITSPTVRTKAGTYLYDRELLAEVSLAYGVNDRFTWFAPWPSFSWRIGTYGKWELVPHAGFAPTGIGTDGLAMEYDQSLSLNVWVAPNHSFVLHAGLGIPLLLDYSARLYGSYVETLRAGYNWNVNDGFILSANVGLSDYLYGATLVSRVMQPSVQARVRVAEGLYIYGSIGVTANVLHSFPVATDAYFGVIGVF